MNFDFSEEQQMVRDSIARFVQDDYDWDTRKVIVASDQGMSRDNWHLFAELGWLSIPFRTCEGPKAVLLQRAVVLPDDLAVQGVL